MVADRVPADPDARSILSRVAASRFLRAATMLQVGSLGLTGIAFLASVLLARTLGPSAFGVYTLVMSAGTTIGLSRRLGQDYAATTWVAEGHAAANRQRVRDALAFYVFLSVATSAIVLPLAMALSPWLAERFFDDPSLAVLLQLYLVQGFWAVVPGWTTIALQATRRIGTLVAYENAISLVTSLVPVAAAVAGFGLLGVFWGQVAASLIAVGAAVPVYRRLSARDPLLPSMMELVRSVVRPGIELSSRVRFGLSIAIDKNLVSLFSLVPILVLGLIVAEAEVGQLRVAISFMAIPAVLLSPISRLLMVDLPRLRATDPAGVRPFFVRVTRVGGLASLALATPFAALAWLLVPLLYGREYEAASGLTLALLLDVASLGLGVAAGPVFRTYDRTDLPIRTNLVLLVVGLPVAYLAAARWGAPGTALVYGGMTLLSRLVSYALCLRIIPR